MAEALRVLAYADLSPAAVLVVEGPGRSVDPGRAGVRGELAHRCLRSAPKAAAQGTSSR